MTSDHTDGSFATGGGLDALSKLRAQKPDALIGRVLGDYTVIGLIAEGGMGRVYRASRNDGSFDRDVAIKVSAASGIGDRVRDLFLQEQKLLAGMNHPNISQLFDAGVTDEGWPYIVMELIDGTPITEYCAQHALSNDRRVGLLVDVVDAVAHAHSRLVVHRDLKPSNILVDAQGRLKLLDFGIAKLIDTTGDAVTRGRPLTPRYASPEQLLGQPVSVASDIYQLGLLIYEVLAGEPVERGKTLSDAIQAAASGGEIRLSAKQQQGLPGDVRLVVAHALRSDPDARYAEAAALRDDLRSFLAGYPLAIAGSGAGYRLAKFLKRNWLPVGTGAVAIIAIAASTVWYTTGLAAARDEAQAQAERAEQESESAKRAQQETAASVRFFKEVFRSVAVDTRELDAISVREMLEAGAARAKDIVPEEAHIRVPALNELAGLYYSFGMLDVVDELADLSRQSAKGSDADPWDIDQADNVKQVLLNVRQEFNGALDINKARWEYVTQYESTGERWVSVRKMAIATSLSSGYRNLGNFEDSKRWLERALEQDEALTLNPAHHVSLINTLATISDEQGEFAAAREYYDQALELAIDKLGEKHVWVGQLLMNLGIHHEWQAQFGAALGYYEEAAPVFEAVYGTDSAKYADLLIATSTPQWLNGDPEGAMVTADAALTLRERLPGTGAAQLGAFVRQVAGLHRELGHLDASQSAYERALELIGEDGNYLSRYWAHLGASDTAQRQGRLGASELHLAAASSIASSNWEADDLRMARLNVALAIQAWMSEDSETARTHWQRVEQHVADLPNLNELNAYLAARRYFAFLKANNMMTEMDAIVARNGAFERVRIR